MELRYEDGGAGRARRGSGGAAASSRRTASPQEFYAELLLDSPAARPARDFLRARDFNGDARQAVRHRLRPARR